MADQAKSTFSRTQVSDAVTRSGWRLVLGALMTTVRVSSTPETIEVVTRALEAADERGVRVLVDVRRNRVVLQIAPSGRLRFGAAEIETAAAITQAAHDAGSVTDPDVSDEDVRSVQGVEVAVDALDIPAVRPFWKAVLGYVGETDDGPTDALVDPLGQGPAVWFQQMDAPRPQRNRLHIDVSVPHDEAHGRLEAALAAGGRLLTDVSAPAYWVLADPEGNEVCISTWQGRD
jgi:4a-hydroxytetrahydrobiopterin dehydratase